MTPVESLYFAIGELAYAVAFSDGKVQKEEREKFHSIVKDGLKEHNNDFDISGIIFQILEKTQANSQAVYERAIREVRMNSQYISPTLKQTIMSVMAKVAEAFPPITIGEFRLLQGFKKELNAIEGDPVYYENRKQAS